MRQAVEEVLKGRLRYFIASREYEVPRTTIEARTGCLNRPKLQIGGRNDDQLPEHRNSPPPRTPPGTPLRTPPRTSTRTLLTSPLIKPPSITLIPTKQFHANSTPSCSHTTQNFVVTTQQVVPVPHSEKKLNLNDRRRGKTAVLTSTPHKEELEESICKRLTKKPKLNFGDTEKAAHIVKLNKKGKINDNE
ncbi:hypothetical protein JTB14_008370 [Gonioctena quinquepunctata]|nr:hypothetical protein JTB14_008370 [Gonioctena quinquepunctata]